MVSLGSDLEELTEEWVEDGVISEEQRRSILEREEGDGGRAVRVILGLGALMVGLGALLFVGANWQRIPEMARLVLLTSVTAAALGGGWKLKYDTEYTKLGAAVVFIGAMLAGASIFLVAQMYHLEADHHLLILLWFAAVLPVAYAAESRSTLLLSLTLFPWWTAAYISGGDAGLMAVEGLLLNLPGYLFYGAALMGVGYLHSEMEFEGFTGSYRAFGLFFVLLTYFILLLTEFQDAARLFEEVYVWVFVAAGFLVSGGTLTYHRRWSAGDWDFIESWHLAAYAAASVLVAVLYLGARLESPDLLLLLLAAAHAGFFSLVSGLVYAGYRDRVMQYINLGLLFFLVYVIYLYVRLLAGYLGGSLAFVVGGLALIAGGTLLERKRREVKQDIEAENQGGEDGAGYDDDDGESGDVRDVDGDDDGDVFNEGDGDSDGGGGGEGEGLDDFDGYLDEDGDDSG